MGGGKSTVLVARARKVDREAAPTYARSDFGDWLVVPPTLVTQGTGCMEHRHGLDSSPAVIDLAVPFADTAVAVREEDIDATCTELCEHIANGGPLHIPAGDAYLHGLTTC